MLDTAFSGVILLIKALWLDDNADDVAVEEEEAMMASIVFVTNATALG